MYNFLRRSRSVDEKVFSCLLLLPGVVTEIYQGWAGGWPLLSAPLYGSVSGLPASTSWARVTTDNTDPMCVH